MDALTSQTSVASYKTVLMAAWPFDGAVMETADFGVAKVLPHLPELKETGFTASRRAWFTSSGSATTLPKAPPPCPRRLAPALSASTNDSPQPNLTHQ
jgi:hypothetical protein